jgi:hypothetical protein
MKEKYIDQHVSPWMDFGIWPISERNPNGAVDIVTMDGQGGYDVAVCVPQPQADQLMAKHNECINHVYALVNAFEAAAPEAFKKFWYEDHKWN